MSYALRWSLYSMLLFGLLCSRLLFAAEVDCSDVFTSPIASSSNSGRAEFGWGSQVYGSDNGGVLYVKSIDQNTNGSVTCPSSLDGADYFCSSSASLPSSGDPISVLTQSGGTDIDLSYYEWPRGRVYEGIAGESGSGDEVDYYPGNNFGAISLTNGAILTFSSNYDEYYIDSIYMGGTGGTLRLPAGTYWVSQDFNLGNNSSIEVVGEGTVKIFIGKKLETGNGAQLNEDGDPLQLAIYSTEDMLLSSRVQGAFIGYSKKKVELSNRADISGALFAENREIILRSASYVRGISNAGEVDFTPLCNASTPTPPETCSSGLNYYTYTTSRWSTSRSPEDATVFQYLVDNYANSSYLQGSSVLTNIDGGGYNYNPHSTQKDYFLGVSSGYIYIPSSGVYGFAIDGDDSVEALIDGEVVTAWYGLHEQAGSPQNPSAIYLSEGWHSLEYRHHENTGYVYYHLYWRQSKLDGDWTSSSSGTWVWSSWVERWLWDDDWAIVPVSQFNTCGSDSGTTTALELSTDATALTCEVHEVSLKALVDEALDESYDGSVTLSTSSGVGEWSQVSGNGSLSASSGGVVTYSFDSSDAGSVTLGLFHPQEGSVTLSASDGSLTADDVAVTFYSYALSGNLSSEVSGSDDNPHWANQSISLTLTAMGKDSDGEGCAAIANYQGDKSLRFWSTYNKPDSGTTQLVVTGSDSVDYSVGTSQSDLTKVPVTFSEGSATVSLNYPDAGRIGVHFWDKDGTILDDESYTLLGDVSADILPAGFVWRNFLNEDEEAVNSNGNFAKAGTPFSGWLVPVMANCTPSPGTTVLTGCNTRNFVVGSNALAVDAELSSPSTAEGGVLGTFTAGDYDSANAQSEGAVPVTDNYWYEVGTLQLTGLVSTYLGHHLSDYSSSANSTLGLFYPDHFELAGVSLDAACSSGNFTYIGQNEMGLNWTLIAQAADNTLTQNYDADLFMVAVVDNNWRFSSSSAVTNFDAGFSVEDTDADWDAGVFTQSNLLSGVAKPLQPQAPVTDGVIGLYYAYEDATIASSSSYSCASDDDDEVYCNLGTAPALRHGRLKLNNAYGSELSGIAASAYLQYYDGSRYLTNSLDSCSSVSSSQLLFSPQATADETLAVVGYGTTTPSLGSSDASLSSLSATQGLLWTYYTSPGVGNTGSISYWMDLEDQLSWLRDDWDGSGAYDSSDDEAVAAEISFGLYRQSERVIFRKNLY